MSRLVEELERDIKALSEADRERLLDRLMLDTDSPPSEVRELVLELGEKAERTQESLDGTLEYLGGLDARLRQRGIEAREEVIRSGERWPFEKPTVPDPDR